MAPPPTPGRKPHILTFPEELQVLILTDLDIDDIDKTVAWFDRHGQAAVFFGRMVPIFRSFISTGSMSNSGSSAAHTCTNSYVASCDPELGRLSQQLECWTCRGQMQPTRLAVLRRTRGTWAAAASQTSRLHPSGVPG